MIRAEGEYAPEQLYNITLLWCIGAYFYLRMKNHFCTKNMDNPPPLFSNNKCHSFCPCQNISDIETGPPNDILLERLVKIENELSTLVSLVNELLGEEDEDFPFPEDKLEL